MSENASESAVASEQAYFETKGEEPIVETEESPVETEAQEAEGAEPVEAEKPQKTVPLAALHEERQRIKELRQELNQTKEQTRIGNERLNQLMQALQAQQQPQIPDRETDPINHFATVQALQQRQIEQQNAFIAQQQAEREQQAQLAQLHQYVNAQEREYVASKPDYLDAVAHLKSVDTRALVALGHDQATAEQIVHRHLTELAANLARQGVSLPERVYALAQAKGYAPKQAETSQRIATAQRGVAASRSLGSGAGTTNTLTLEALANMPVEDFAEATKDPRVFRRLMGG